MSQDLRRIARPGPLGKLRTGSAGPRAAQIGQTTRSLELAHLRQHLGHVEVCRRCVDPLEAHDALLVDDDHRPPGRAVLLVEDAVALRHLSVGIEVGEDRVGDVAKGGGEGCLGPPWVRANTQNLGIFLLQCRERLPEGRDLVRSTAGKGEDVEGQDHVLLASIAA